MRSVINPGKNDSKALSVASHQTLKIYEAQTYYASHLTNVTPVEFITPKIFTKQLIKLSAIMVRIFMYTQQWDKIENNSLPGKLHPWVSVASVLLSAKPFVGQVNIVQYMMYQ